MLGLIKHDRIHFVTDLQIAGQPQKLLLSFRQLFYLALKSVLPALELTNLCEKRTVCRMVPSEFPVHIRLLEAELLDAGFDCDFLLQEAFGLEADINSVCAKLVCAKRLLGTIDLRANARQLLLYKNQLGGRLGRIPINILPDIGLGYLLQKSLSDGRISILVGQGQNSRLLANLIYGDLFPKLVDDRQLPFFDDSKARPRSRLNAPNLKSDSTSPHNVADFRISQCV